jgi:hypothetical protein
MMSLDERLSRLLTTAIRRWREGERELEGKGREGKGRKKA